jgi:hypothetical protein
MPYVGPLVKKKVSIPPAFLYIYIVELVLVRNMHEIYVDGR